MALALIVIDCVIFDEYYSCLNDSKLVLDAQDRWPAIFGLGDTVSLIISTGHYSEAFKEFLTQRFDSLKIIK